MTSSSSSSPQIILLESKEKSSMESIGIQVEIIKANTASNTTPPASSSCVSKHQCQTQPFVDLGKE